MKVKSTTQMTKAELLDVINEKNTVIADLNARMDELESMAVVSKAEVLDADAFEFFLEKGIFNKEVASKFKDNVLSKGGTEKPMQLHKRFRGKEPKPDALLKRAGLLSD